MDEGVLAGYPMVDLKAVLYDGSFHDVDSSGMSFEIASSQALRKGVSDAAPILLEPIMKLDVIVPDAYTGEVMSDLNGKRGRILGMTPMEGTTRVEAEVPLSEVQRYAQDLRSVSQGRGEYSLVFDRYEQVPANLEAQGDRGSQARPRRGKDVNPFQIRTVLTKRPRHIAVAGPQFFRKGLA